MQKYLEDAKHEGFKCVKVTWCEKGEGHLLAGVCVCVEGGGIWQSFEPSAFKVTVYEYNYDTNSYIRNSCPYVKMLLRMNIAELHRKCTNPAYVVGYIGLASSCLTYEASKYVTPLASYM